MKIRQLSHFIFFVTAGGALLLSILFSIAVYFIAQAEAVKDSKTMSNDLISTVNASASAAAFSGNDAVANDVIDGLLSTDLIYSVRFFAYADEVSDGFVVFKETEQAGSGMDDITRELISPFNDDVIGELTVKPNRAWVASEAADRALFLVTMSVTVIFGSSLLAAQVIRILITRPIVKAAKQVKTISLSDDAGIEIPAYLNENEIGALIDGFNTMLYGLHSAILVERSLRTDMEEVQERLEQAKIEAERATIAKSHFLANMSHEIRTPMNSLIGFMDLALESSKLDSDSRKHLEIANHSAQYLMRLINDILDVSKIESGKLELDESPFDLSELLFEIKELMDIKATEKRLDLRLTMPVNLSRAYHGDQFRLRQILINLVGNAIKFTGQGTVEINVESGGNDSVTFSVSDTGIGIPEDKIQHILAPFTQVDASITRRYGGSGLGTTISAELIGLMGGELLIESEPDVGSRFYFTISLSPCGTIAVANAIDGKTISNINHLTILVVDDTDENVKLVKIRLEKQGHTVYEASNGHEALEQIQQHNFDLVLMDINMPIMGGIEATKAIRQLAAPVCDVPIIAMTANALVEETRTIIAAGMDDVVTKPIDFQRLFSVITNLVPNATLTAYQGEKTQSVDNTQLIDIQFGLATWQDEQEYHKALFNFAENNQSLADQIQIMDSSKDSDGLLNELHKLKGVTANLGCQRLASVCDEVERSITEEGAELAPSDLESVQICLQQTLEAIRCLSVPQKNAVDSLPIDGIIEPQEKLNQLKVACEKYDPDMAEIAFSQLSSSLSGTELIALGAAIENFDFNLAIRLIDELKQKF